jgi:surface polysaccharide O-acyltransferase-like enzyme
MGQVMLVLGTLSAAAIGQVTVLGNLGRSSLGIYVVHLVLLYGWAGEEGLAALFFRRLPLVLALGLAALVLVASASLARQLPRVLQWLETLAAPRWLPPRAEPLEVPVSRPRSVPPRAR